MFYLQGDVIMKQNQAVVQFTKQVLGDLYNPEVPVSQVVTKEQRVQIVDLLVKAFENREIDLTKPITKAKLRTYCVGLVTNWFNKSRELNGNQKFKIKNPGARTNEAIKQALSLKEQLIKQGADAEQIAQIDTFIEQERAKKPALELSVDELNNLPSNIQNIVSL